ncbi:hypothetical protein AB0N17_25980 [Streptomyces sp. NPDC051133]|uniref:hypothetical protein n=1 Tax=Streptomyces sp. NPDC051133 TaxID=3155521 RepID=UPI00342C7B2C
MFLELAHATTATAAAAPWWGAALGAGVGALGAGVVTAAVSYINNRASRKQLDKQLAAQQAMLKQQLDAQREQVTEQLNTQLEVAGMNNEANHVRDREGQKSELRKWQLETRRETYVDFVVAVEKLRDTIATAGRLLAGTWPLPEPLSETDLSELQRLETNIVSLYEEAFQRAQVVRLTGPDDVAEYAKSLGNTMTDYVTFSSERFRAARRNERSETLREWQEAVREMNRLLQSFVDTAYTVVNLTSSEPQSPVPPPRHADDSSVGP